jgi:pimeloyl-ACP methyl ester carboxylesterase
MAFFEPDKETKIYYRLSGQGKNTVVFINGLLMTSGGWFNQTDFLKKDFKVLTYDQRCQGASTKFEEPFSYTKQAEDLKMLLDYLNIENAIIAGISYGSAVAKEFAVRYPKNCRKLILLSPVRNLDFRLKCIFNVLNQLLDADNFDAFYRLIMTISFSRQSLNGLENDFEKGKAVLQKILSTKAVKALINSIDYENGLGNYSEIETETLIIGAKYDDFLNPLDAKTIHGEIKNSRLESVNCGHASITELPEKINFLINDFIKSD